MNPEDFIPTLTDEEVTFFLSQDPLGEIYLEREDTLSDPRDRRWFLFELFLARAGWFREAIAHIAAVRLNQSLQLVLL